MKPVGRARSLSLHLLQSAAAPRCGLLLPYQFAPHEPCDLPTMDNVAVPADPARPWQGAAGAVAYGSDAAIAGAIGEGLERYAAALAVLPVLPRCKIPASSILDESNFAFFSDEQKAGADFPWPMPSCPDDLFIEVFNLADNRPVWVAQELVGLGPRSGKARLPSTSSGLAAHRDSAEGPWLTLLRATEELLERDALAVTWLNGLGGREIPVPEKLRRFADSNGGQVLAFDLTQCWNPHPVVAVTGYVPEEGRPRFGLGVACRSDYAGAYDKAILEWGQALAFAGHMNRYGRDRLPREAAALRTFDEHAMFYTLRPELWSKTALVARRQSYSRPADAPDVPVDAKGQLYRLVRLLNETGIDLYYRELTTADVAAAGLRVMRVLSAQLSGLHADERVPFLGGRCRDIAWRYRDLTSHTPFPNPLPHPLG